jgi:hypothetical protein
MQEAKDIQEPVDKNKKLPKRFRSNNVLIDVRMFEVISGKQTIPGVGNNSSAIIFRGSRNPVQSSLTEFFETEDVKDSTTVGPFMSFYLC